MTERHDNETNNIISLRSGEVVEDERTIIDAEDMTPLEALKDFVERIEGGEEVEKMVLIYTRPSEITPGMSDLCHLAAGINKADALVMLKMLENAFVYEWFLPDEE